MYIRTGIIYCICFDEKCDDTPKKSPQNRNLEVEPGERMRGEREIVSQVYAAKTDPQAADEFVRQYLGFIKSETVKFTGRVPREGQDDELAVAMLAFYETILAYDRDRGAFMPLAAIAIRNRLIDYVRREGRHSALSLDATGDGNVSDIKSTLADENDMVAQTADRLSAKAELEKFSKQLSEFGLSLPEVADNCPRQERTMAACLKVLACARAKPTLLKKLEQTKKLPISELAGASGVSRKTLERHRKYLVAILLAYTNGYEIIRSHLRQL